MKYCFDIDNTIFYTDKDYNIISLNDDIIKKINKLYRNGNVIIIYTGRHWNKLEMTVKQLSLYNIQYHSLIMGKPIADVYVDDKAMRPDEFKR